MAEDLRDTAIKFSEVLPNYADFIMKGFDTVEETYNHRLTPKHFTLLMALKEEAKQQDLRNASKDLVTFSGVNFHLYPYGGKGYLFFIENDDYKISIGNPAVNWGVSVHYYAKGLWGRGIYALKEEVNNIFKDIMVRPNVKGHLCKLRRADVAFDIYSPSFTQEMIPAFASNVVALSGVMTRSIFKTPLIDVEDTDIVDSKIKKNRLETLTIGSKASLQVQIYDKTRKIKNDIKQAFFYELWKDCTGNLYTEDVWRSEFRFSSKFLRERNITTIEDFALVESDLLEEAMLTRRITVPSTTDINRGRWPLHPLWSIIYKIKGEGHVLAKGKRITDYERDELVKNLKKQIAGGLRTAVVLAKGVYVNEIMRGFMIDAVKILKTDQKHHKKVVKTLKRYIFI